MNITTSKSIIITQDNAKPLTFQPAKMMRDHLALTPRFPMATIAKTPTLRKRIGRLLGSVLLIGAIVTLTGCAQMGINKQQFGTVTGAVLGGVLGSHVGQGAGRTAATIGGTLLGGFIGGSIGASMDKVDKLELRQALEQNHINQTSSWRNPDNGNRYHVTPTRTYYHEQQPCREYHMNATIGGETKQVYGRACRTADGQWRIQN